MQTLKIAYGNDPHAMHGHYSTLLTRLAGGFGLWYIALRYKSNRLIPIHPFGINAKFGSPVFPKKIQRIFNFSQGLILVYKVYTVKR